MVHKQRIPHVDTAKGDQRIFHNTALHALAQIEAGHYRIENATQTEVEPGRVRITFDRVETNLDHPAAEPVGL